jgi:hypothetical protein
MVRCKRSSSLTVETLGSLRLQHANGTGGRWHQGHADLCFGRFDVENDTRMLVSAAFCLCCSPPLHGIFKPPIESPGKPPDGVRLMLMLNFEPNLDGPPLVACSWIHRDPSTHAAKAAATTLSLIVPVALLCIRAHILLPLELAQPYH